VACYEAAREYYHCKPDEAGVSALPAEWQRELVALRLVNRDVNNGGYLQFLANHGREACEYASRALRAISARQQRGAAFLGFFPSTHGGRPGFVPDKAWPGERVPVEVAYRAAAEYLHTSARPQSVRRFEL
jgi:hypothetical protein